MVVGGLSFLGGIFYYDFGSLLSFTLGLCARYSFVWSILTDVYLTLSTHDFIRVKPISVFSVGPPRAPTPKDLRCMQP